MVWLPACLTDWYDHCVWYTVDLHSPVQLTNGAGCEWCVIVLYLWYCNVFCWFDGVIGWRNDLLTDVITHCGYGWYMRCTHTYAHICNWQTEQLVSDVILLWRYFDVDLVTD